MLQGQHAAPSLGRPDVQKDNTKSVYVKNLPFRGTEDDIRAFFSQAGTIVDVRRGLNEDGKLLGFGFVQFDSAEAVQAALQLNGMELLGRELHIDVATATGQARPPLAVGKPVEGCWFCLSNPNADVNLVASIGDECYVAVDKGAINGAHVLVVPIEHYPNTLTLSPGAHAELEAYISALRSCHAGQGKELVGFERFMTFRKSGGNHCHVNLLPIPAATARQARQVFEKRAAAHGFSFSQLTAGSGEAGREALRKAVGEGEYFLAHLPDGSKLVHPIAHGERHPLNFGRDVIAELAAVPDRADWKNCQVTPEEEEQRTNDFKALFKPYDIMQQG